MAIGLIMVLYIWSFARRDRIRDPRSPFKLPAALFAEAMRSSISSSQSLFGWMKDPRYLNELVSSISRSAKMTLLPGMKSLATSHGDI